MSSLRNPVGPLSPKVYWRRRLIVGLAALAVIIIIVLIVVKPGSGDADANGTATESSEEATDTTETDAATGDVTECDPEDIELIPVTDAGSYAEGQLPHLSLRLTNTGSAPCSFNVGNSQQELLITSGSDRIWSSKDCQVEPEDKVVTLPTNEPQTTTPVAWDRTRSSTDTCDSERTAAVAGGASYHLSVSVGEATSESTQQIILN